jgi:two-component system, response regulator YesN
MSESLFPNNPCHDAPRAASETAGLKIGAQGMARVLLVDDKAEMRELLTQLFQRWSYATVTAGTVAEAQHAILTRGPFKVVVCDFELPDGTGLQFWSWLKWDRRDDARFLLMSGSASFVRHHSDDFAFLSKPFRPEELQRSVAELIGDSREKE